MHSLHELISRLESDGELLRISAVVNPILEIAAIANRICKMPDGGKALLFEKPAGSSSFQLAVNLFGSQNRTATAMGLSTLDELTHRLKALLDKIAEIKIETVDLQIANLPDFKQFAPHYADSSEQFMLNMNPPNLTHFPFLQSWEGDGAASGYGRYITMGEVFTIDSDGSTPNCGIYRIQIRGELEAAIQCKNGSGAAKHLSQYLQIGKPMPVAIVLGGDPTLLFSAMFPLPGNLDEITFAGFLRGRSIEMAKCSSIPIYVPKSAEIVIEGYIEPGEVVIEGPFGNHTGFYSPAASAPLMRITAIRHKKDAIIPATIVGPPPMEDCWMAKAWERLLLAFLQKVVPSIKDIHFPPESVFHQSAVISLENPKSGMVRKVSAELWQLPWFSSAKLLLFVAADTEKIDLSTAFWKTINTTDFSNNIIHDTVSSRIAIDATSYSDVTNKIAISTEISELVSARWGEYGFA